MRLIGHLQGEREARTFSDYLYVQGIENQLELMQGEGWGVWVNDEEKLESAAGLLADFRQHPADVRYQAKARSAPDLRAREAKNEEAWRNKLRSRRHLFRPLTAYGVGAITIALIVASVGVFLLSKFGADLQAVMPLFITDFAHGDSRIAPDFSLPEIWHGQIWRLFTPMFIHFNVMHILFNMLWLRDLGSMIEGRQSSAQLVLLVLVIAACSNLAQFYIGHSPTFGGMSGVVYGLLGYIWIRGKLDPGSGLLLHPTTLTMMLIWLVLCFTGLLGHVANIAHVAGLLMGMAWGWLSSLRYR